MTPPLQTHDLSWAPAPGAEPVISRLSLELPRGSFVALVGPSGCGKSSLLRLLAGLRPPSSGTVSGIPEQKAFVFQDPALLPWLTVRENVALPGKFSAIDPPEQALARVGLAGLEHRLPRELSGGQAMRVSLARALVSRPELVLLDEAFTALDGVTRRGLQRDFRALQQAVGFTAILVTHELTDAVWLADRVIALDGPPLRVIGRLEVSLGPNRDPEAPGVAPLVHTLAGWFSGRGDAGELSGRPRSM